MTKDAYFEMCEALGSEPLEEEIPVEFEDLLVDVQEAFAIYQTLKDEWDTMNGNYMGKNLSGFRDILIIMDVPLEDHKTMLNLVNIIDQHRSKAIRDNKPKTT